MFSNDYKKETAQEWAQNPLSKRFLYFVNYLRPSNNRLTPGSIKLQQYHATSEFH